MSIGHRATGAPATGARAEAARFMVALIAAEPLMGVNILLACRR